MIHFCYKSVILNIIWYNTHMYEIELKAHVRNRQKTIELIEGFAIFCGTTQKSDTYFHLFSTEEKKESEKHLTCRLRHESHTGPDGKQEERNLFTYKSKELRTDSNGASYEVNEENETLLSEPEALRKFLFDCGFTEAYTKQKDVRAWTYQTDYGTANIELCNVVPLGDFLEIEIICENCNNEDKINDELKKILVKSGIDLNDIEKKYYSELLKEASGGKNV